MSTIVVFGQKVTKRSFQDYCQITGEFDSNLTTGNEQDTLESCSNNFLVNPK